MKKIGIVFLLMLAMIMVAVGILLASDGSSGGDGKTTCRNCGREKPLSIFGFCSICQEGYDEWEKKQRAYN